MCQGAFLCQLSGHAAHDADVNALAQEAHDHLQQDGYTTRIAAVACRYPQPADGADACSGASSGPSGFWAALQGGANLQRVVPASRWDIDAVYTPDTAAKCALFFCS